MSFTSGLKSGWVRIASCEGSRLTSTFLREEISSKVGSAEPKLPLMLIAPC